MASQYPSWRRLANILRIFGDDLGGKMKWGDLLILTKFLVLLILGKLKLIFEVNI